MLGKTLILGLISAGAAGTIVYYGTAPQGSSAAEIDRSAAAKPQNVEKNNTKIAPKAPTVSKAGPAHDNDKMGYGSGTSGKSNAHEGSKMESPQAQIGGETPLKTGGYITAEAGAPDAAAHEGILGDPKSKPQSRWLDQYLKKNQADTGDISSEELDAAPEVTVDQNHQQQDMPIPRVSEAASTEVIDGPQYFIIEDGKLIEVNPGDAPDEQAAAPSLDQPSPEQPSMERSEDLPSMESLPPLRSDNGDETRQPGLPIVEDIADMASDASPVIRTVMKEASLIKKPELRDQAYFEITEFALSEGRFETAQMAHDMIVQDELAYTAKSRIAVAYAQAGQATEAFNTISDVDEAELRDFMRLQVIEALIAPENLPQEWQENR